MSSDYDRLSPEFALVEAMDAVPLLGGKVSALQPKPSWEPPFVFYIPSEDEEEEALDGPTGLQSFSAELHCVAATYRSLQLMCQQIKKALRVMQGTVYSTPDNDPDMGVKGRVLIERMTATQTSPDLIEMEVGFYRRIYRVDLEYQTEEVYEE